MSVPVRDRKASQFDVLNIAHQLAIYTIKICCNENIFLPKYREAVTNDLISDAKNIYKLCRAANRIKIKSRSAKDRLELQAEAGKLCNDLLDSMLIAERVFHLSKKRIKYWGDMTIKVREEIRGWMQSDRLRIASAHRNDIRM